MARAATLIWSAPALDDLDEIAARIAQDRPAAAAAFVDRVLASVERLRRFPASGRRMPELPRSHYREVVVAPCRIVYRRDGARVLIVHVFRGERALRSQRLR
jgi:plasmid stabilization system protein ParE